MEPTATARIFETLRAQIESGALKEGARLMSLRRAAEYFGVSKNIIVVVYDQLVSHALAVSRPGAGFFVRSVMPVKAEPPNLRAASDIVSLLHAQLDRSYTVLVGDGRPPESWTLSKPPRMPKLDGDKGYSTPHGLMALRNCIASAHHAAGIKVNSNQIVTTFGANHALDLIIRRFVRAKETVLVDDPGYYPLFAKLRLADVNVVGIPRTAQGPDAEVLEAMAKTHRARVFFTQSLAQNPVGTSIDLPTAHAVLQVAERHGMLVVDNDPFIDLPDLEGTRLAQLDQFRLVIQVGTFSKILTPIYRSGYMIASPDIAASMAELKMILTINTSSHTESLITEIILSRQYEKACAGMAKRLVDERKAVTSKLAKMGYKLQAPPTGGLYGLMCLPDTCDDLEIARRAAGQGIFLAPGTLFRATGTPSPPTLRLNWSRANDSRFFSFLRSLI